MSLKRDGSSSNKLTLVATYQGCNEPIGVCYAPINKVVELTLPMAKAAAGLAANAISNDAMAAPAFAAQRRKRRIQRRNCFNHCRHPPLRRNQPKSSGCSIAGNFWLILTGFFGIGLLLSFTPCVFPMFPILSGIIAKKGEHITKRRGFILSLAYVMGMAITYAAAGVAAGLSGAMLSATLQNAWVLGTFALVFVVLAFSMFGFYELQLPTFLQSKVSEEAGHLKGGHLDRSIRNGGVVGIDCRPLRGCPAGGALCFISARPVTSFWAVSIVCHGLGNGCSSAAAGRIRRGASTQSRSLDGVSQKLFRCFTPRRRDLADIAGDFRRGAYAAMGSAVDRFSHLFACR